MFGRLDRYLVRTFIVPWLLCLGSVLGLYIVIDLFTKLDDFLQQPSFLTGVVLAASYYVTFVPMFLKQVLPMVTLLAAMIALVRLAKQNELTALKACGISFQRTLAPLLAISALMAAVLLVDQEMLVPHLESQMQELKVQLTDYKKRLYEKLYTIDLQGRVFLIEQFDTQDARRPLRNIHMVWRDRPDEFAYAAEGGWRDGKLVLRNVTLYKEPFTGTPDREPSAYRAELLLDSSVTAQQLKRNRLNLEYRTIGELREVGRLFPYMAPRLRVEIHQRLAFCAANVVLLLVGIPFAFQQQTRSALLGIGVALLVGVGYYFFASVSYYLGTVADPVLPPAVAGWLPVLGFGGVGVYLYRTMPT